jgi:hypothetical protein
MKYYAHEIIVKPVGHFTMGFPIDMLRYDELMPVSQTDSTKIHRCCETPDLVNGRTSLSNSGNEMSKPGSLLKNVGDRFCGLLLAMR